MVDAGLINSNELYLVEGEEGITYTFTDGTAGNFTVTPSNGEAQTVSVGLSNVTNHQQVHDVAWDKTNKKITRSKNGTASDVVQFVQGGGIALTAADGKLTIAHSNASITAKTAAAQSAKTLTWGGTFTLYEEKYDAYGHITGVASYNMKMPANPNTDEKVKQNLTSGNASYKLLTTTTASPTSGTAYEANYSANLAYNPSENKLSTGNLDLTGELDVVGNANLHNQTTIDSATVGSLLVNGSANFNQIPTAPTAAAGTSNTQLATTEFVTNATSGLSSAMHFIGKATVAITDGSTTNPSISGYDFTSDRKPGDVIIDKDNAYEYVWTIAGAWERLGPDGSYKITQSAVDTGAATTNKWVSRIQQNANGVITATMGTLDTSGTWSGTATKATQDGSGNNIVNTYLTKATGVTNVAWDNTNKKLTKTINGTTSDIVAVTVNNPTLAWNTESVIAKIGTVDVKVKLPENPNTNTDTLVKQTAKSNDAEYKILTTTSVSPTSGDAAEAAYDTEVTINPNTHNITAACYNESIKMATVKAWGKTGPYDEGWKRVCALKGFQGYGVGRVYINGNFSSEESTIAAFEIAFSYTGWARIKQTIGSKITTPDKVRLVYSGTGGKWYFDIHIPARTASSATGDRYVTFVGKLAVSEKDESTNFLTEEPTTTTLVREIISTKDQPTITVDLTSTTAGAFTGADMTTGISGVLPITNGGTGATTQEAAFSNIVAPGGVMTGSITFVGGQTSAWNDKGILFTKGARIGENSNGALGLYSAERFYLRPNSGTASSGKGIEIDNTSIIPSVNNEMSLGDASHKWTTVYATAFNGNGSALTNLNASNLASGTVAFDRLPSIYWANLTATSAASYSTAPEMASIKLNGNTSATAASTKNVVLQYDSSLEVLNFVFT